MSQKTIIQRAQGYGSSPVTATVKLDGTTIYQGEIPTTPQSMPVLPDDWTPGLGVDAWSWPTTQDFSGSFAMTVEVHTGVMLLCDTYFTLSDPPANTAPIGRVLYSHVQDSVATTDPLTNVTINGAVVSHARLADLAGQRNWKISAGDTLSCTVNIVPQSLPPATT